MDLKKPQCYLKPGLEKTSGFFCFFVVVFFGFFGVFWGFCPEERVLGFFPVSRILLGASRL
jgi:hypothetical protein